MFNYFTKIFVGYYFCLFVLGGLVLILFVGYCTESVNSFNYITEV